MEYLEDLVAQCIGMIGMSTYDVERADINRLELSLYYCYRKAAIQGGYGTEAVDGKKEQSVTPAEFAAFVQRHNESVKGH